MLPCLHNRSLPIPPIYGLRTWQPLSDAIIDLKGLAGYRRRAANQKDRNWSVTDPSLFNSIFTGKAKATRCIHCLSEEHTTEHCPSAYGPLLQLTHDASVNLASRTSNSGNAPPHSRTSHSASMPSISSLSLTRTQIHSYPTSTSISPNTPIHIIPSIT